MNDKLSLPISIIIAGLLIGGGIYLSKKVDLSPGQTGGQEQRRSGEQLASEDLSKTLRPIDANDHVLGSPSARIVIVEYSDTECPYCKTFHSAMRQVMQEYGQSGQVAWVYRHYPIAELHSQAPKEAEALECVGELGGNSKFWEFTNKVYEVTPSNNGLDMAELPKIAGQIGLSKTAFTTCLDSGQFAPRVQADAANAQELGAPGTPFSVVIDTKNNQYYPIPGYIPYENLKAAIIGILSS